MSTDTFEDILYGNLPFRPSKDEWMGLYPVGNTWTYLEHLMTPFVSNEGSVMLQRTQSDTWWSLKEVLHGEVVFRMERSRMDGARKEHVNCFGLIGVSQLDVNQRDVIITEGVSDYIMAKMLCTDKNVLGFTNLGGSCLARSIVVSLFDEALIISDNDANHEGGNIGYRTSRNIQSELRSYGMKASVYLPEGKDLCDTVFNRIRTYL